MTRAEDIGALVLAAVDPQRRRMFVRVTMELGVDRTQLHIHGPKRLRKKRLIAMMRRAAYESVVETIERVLGGKPGF